MRITHAITRLPGRSFASGLTTAGLGEPDLDLALYQHDAYGEALRRAGATVVTLPPEDDLPDATFVEDTAVVVGDAAILTRPGHPARLPEAERIAPSLARHLRLQRIVEPGFLDGGDVLEVQRPEGCHFFVGVSSRTNRAGAEQLGAFIEQNGHTWQPVEVSDALHLKSSVTFVAGRYVLTPLLADMAEFAGQPSIVLDKADAYAANCLEVNNYIIMPAGYPAAEAQLAALGKPIITVDVSEFRKMDGGLSCLSLRFCHGNPRN